MKTPEQETAWQSLIDCVGAWRDAKCTTQFQDVRERGKAGFCDGDNHLAECPVERARQDVIAAHNNVLQLKAEK